MHPLASYPRLRALTSTFVVACIAALAAGCRVSAQAPVTPGPVLAAGQLATLDIREAGNNSVRITLKPLAFRDDFPPNPALADRRYPSPALSVRDLRGPVRAKMGHLDVEVRPSPLTVTVRGAEGRLVQELIFETDGRLSFKLDDSPVLGLGEGGPKPAPGRVCG